MTSPLLSVQLQPEVLLQPTAFVEQTQAQVGAVAQEAGSAMQMSTGGDPAVPGVYW